MTPRLGAYPPDIAIPVHNLAIRLTEAGRRQVALARSAARRRPIPVLGRGIPEAPPDENPSKGKPRRPQLGHPQRTYVCGHRRG